MGERRSPRIKMVFPIRLWGTDSAGNPYNVLAYTLNVSRQGARVAGVYAALGVGDPVTVQYKQSRALFKVVWVGQPGSPTQSQIGIELLEVERQIWPDIEQTEKFVDAFSTRANVGSPPADPAAARLQPTAAIPIEEIEASEDVPPAAFQGPLPEVVIEVPSDSQSDFNPDDILLRATRALLDLEQLVQRTPPSPAALQEFRDAVARIRQTTWVLQQWHEIKREDTTPFPLLSYLNAERLKFAVQSLQDLVRDTAVHNLELDDKLLKLLLDAVQRLRPSMPSSEDGRSAEK